MKWKIKCTDKKGSVELLPEAHRSTWCYQCSWCIFLDCQIHWSEVYDRTSVATEDDVPEYPVKKQQPWSYSSSCVRRKKKKHEPQRYVSLNDKVVELSGDLYSTHKRKAAFMLKNPQDGETYPLYKNQWLPEALSCGTQPYLIGREGIPFHSGVKQNNSSVSIKRVLIL